MPAPADPSPPPPTSASEPTGATPVLCPYCGEAVPMASRCASCRGLLDPLSRQASQNAMGPWFFRDPSQPFRPGCSYETIVALIRRGKIVASTVVRGPTTRQFWCPAGRTPGIAHLVGFCHECGADVRPEDQLCDECGADFVIESDRQHLGLAEVEPIPGQPAPTPAAPASWDVNTDVGASKSRASTLAPGGGESVGVSPGDLTDAVALLTGRLSAQSRLIAGLSLAVVALLAAVLIGGGWWVWRAISPPGPDPIASPPAESPANGPASSPTGSAGTERPEPLAAGVASASEHPPELANAGNTTPHSEPAAPSGDGTGKPGTEPKSPGAPSVQPGDLAGLIGAEAAALVREDTAASLTRALVEMTEWVRGGCPDPKAAERVAGVVGRRREQLLLNGLP